MLADTNTSQKELSDRTGISESSISKFLSSKREPKYSQIVSMANALNLTLTQLLMLDDSMSTGGNPYITENFIVFPRIEDKFEKLSIDILVSLNTIKIDYRSLYKEELKLDAISDLLAFQIHSGSGRTDSGLKFKKNQVVSFSKAQLSKLSWIIFNGGTTVAIIFINSSGKILKFKEHFSLLEKHITKYHSRRRRS